MNSNLLGDGLFSNTRRAVLALLFGQTKTSFYTKQILDAVKIGRGTVQRELKSLTDVGIIIREVQGRQVYYRANEKCPIFSELRSLVRKTFGVSEVIRQSLEPAAEITSTPLTGILKRRLKVNEAALTGFCRLNHIQKLSLFGSVLRADFKPESDIDMLVEFQPGKTPGFLKLGDMEEQLSGLIGGRKIDLRTPQDLSVHFRDRVIKEAKALCR